MTMEINVQPYSLACERLTTGSSCSRAEKVTARSLARAAGLCPPHSRFFQSREKTPAPFLSAQESETGQTSLPFSKLAAPDYLSAGRCPLSAKGWLAEGCAFTANCRTSLLRLAVRPEHFSQLCRVQPRDGRWSVADNRLI